MKKTLLFIAIGLFALATQAQTPISAGVHGRLLGYKFSAPTREYLTSFKPGFEFGAYTRIGLTKVLYFQPELGFSYIGGKIEPDGLREINYKAAAFNIPLLVGASVVASGDAGFRFYLGLGNTIPILNSINIEKDALKEHFNYSLGIKSASYEISGIVGVGFDIMDFSIDLRYGRTFNPSVTIDNPTTGASDKFYQNTYSLSIAYKIIKP